MWNMMRSMFGTRFANVTSYHFWITLPWSLGEGKVDDFAPLGLMDLFYKSQAFSLCY